MVTFVLLINQVKAFHSFCASISWGLKSWTPSSSRLLRVKFFLFSSFFHAENSKLSVCRNSPVHQIQNWLLILRQEFPFVSRSQLFLILSQNPRLRFIIPYHSTPSLIGTSAFNRRLLTILKNNKCTVLFTRDIAKRCRAWCSPPQQIFHPTSN